MGQYKYRGTEIATGKINSNIDSVQPKSGYTAVEMWLSPRARSLGFSAEWPQLEYFNDAITNNFITSMISSTTTHLILYGMASIYTLRPSIRGKCTARPRVFAENGLLVKKATRSQGS